MNQPSSQSAGGLGLLASGAGDGKIIVFQIESSQSSDGVTPSTTPAAVKVTPVAAVRDAHGVADVNCVSWLEREDGKGRGVLASCGDDGSVRVWRVLADE